MNVNLARLCWIWRKKFIPDTFKPEYLKVNRFDFPDFHFPDLKTCAGRFSHSASGSEINIFQLIVLYKSQKSKHNVYVKNEN
jgi:hypothetical protein